MSSWFAVLQILKKCPFKIKFEGAIGEEGEEIIRLEMINHFLRCHSHQVQYFSAVA